MTKILVDKLVLEQALEALKCVDLQSLVPDYGSGHYSVARLDGPQVKSAITVMEAALAETVQKPMATLYGTLPIYDTAPKTVERVQEPVAQLHPNHFKPNPDGTEWCREVLLYSPNNEGDKLRGVNTRVKLYTSPPQRLPLTEEEIERITDEHWPDFVAFTRAVERAHRIGE